VNWTRASEFGKKTRLPLGNFLDRLREAWCAETSYAPKEWTGENPAWGQCAATALAIMGEFGGEIRSSRAIPLGTGDPIPHYYNVLGNGAVLDLTWQQFPKGYLPSQSRKRTPAGKDVRGRAALLLTRIGARVA